VLTHECGHLFGWPDEYWAEGGFVHQQYIARQQLDFTAGASLKGQATWQMDSDPNLMGQGANHDGASTPGYYLYGIRDWFASKTGKPWKVTT
jgi:type VI secretion system secreted protein VgrG